MNNTTNIVSTDVQLTSLPRKELAEMLQRQMNRNSELSQDIRQIVTLFSQFIAENPIPKKLTIFWVTARIGAIATLLKEVFHILKTKGYVAQS